MVSNTPSTTTQPQRCVACREPIQPGASLCPHCGSAQTQRIWRRVNLALKWIGGITATLSLLILTSQVADLVANWTRTQTAVSDLLLGARMEAEVGDKLGALELLREAQLLDPASREVRQEQVRIAMQQIDAIPATNDVYPGMEVVEKLRSSGLISALYVIAATTKGREQSDILARLAWLDILRHRAGKNELDIDGGFKRALQADPDNADAHVMWADWILYGSSDTDYPDGRVATAMRHYEQALAGDGSREAIRRAQLEALNKGGEEAQWTLVRVALNMHSTDEMPELIPYRDLAWIFEDLTSNNPDHRERVEKGLLAKASPAELISLCDLVLVHLPPGETYQRYRNLRQSVWFARGLFAELLNDQDKALDSYRRAQAEFLAYPEALRWAAPEFNTLLTRHIDALLQVHDESAHPMLLITADSDSRLAVGDVLLVVGETDLPTEADWDELANTQGEGGVTQAKVLRRGQVEQLKLQGELRRTSLRTLTAPESLLRGALREPSQAEILYREWLTFAALTP